jgi:hypothetical protein
VRPPFSKTGSPQRHGAMLAADIFDS